jgi:hypothetical protein
VLLNASEAPIWSSEQHRYGVNGKKIPGGPDNRTEMWNDQVEG